MIGGAAQIKSEAFAIRVVKLYKYLSENKKEYVLSKQILRSGTSIGANLAESENAITKADFINKIYVSLKECSETLYWLRLLKNAGFLTEKSFNDIYKDCEELKKILSATTKTLEKKRKKVWFYIYFRFPLFAFRFITELLWQIY